MNMLSHLNLAFWSPLLSSPPIDTNLKITSSFGSAEWANYLKVDVPNIQIPRDALDRLEQPCPFWQGKKVAETHQLCLIPSLSFDAFWLKVTGTNPRPSVQDKKQREAPYWILMTKQILPGSRDEACPLVASSSTMGYDRPTALEAAVNVYVLRHIKGWKIYARSGTRCLEQHSGYPLNILSSASGIMDLSICDWKGQHGEARVLRF